MAPAPAPVTVSPVAARLHAGRTMAAVASNAAARRRHDERRRSTTWTRAGACTDWRRHVASTQRADGRLDGRLDGRRDGRGRTDGVSRAIQMEISFPSPPPPPPPPPPSPPLRCPSARRNVSPTAASIRPVADHVRSLVSVAALAVALRGLPLALPSASVLSHAFFLRRRFSGDYRLHLKEEDPKSGEEDRYVGNSSLVSLLKRNLPSTSHHSRTLSSRPLIDD